MRSRKNIPGFDETQIVILKMIWWVHVWWVALSSVLSILFTLFLQVILSYTTSESLEPLQILIPSLIVTTHYFSLTIIEYPKTQTQRFLHIFTSKLILLLTLQTLITIFYLRGSNSPVESYQPEVTSFMFSLYTLVNRDEISFWMIEYDLVKLVRLHFFKSKSMKDVMKITFYSLILSLLLDLLVSI